MVKTGLYTARFLDLSETFIYEPLRLFQRTETLVYAWQRRHADVFPYAACRVGQDKFLSAALRQDKIQLLHAHYGYMGVAALGLLRKYPVPLLTSFYGLDVYQHTRNPFYRWQLRRLFRRGRLFLACSEKMRGDLLRLGAPPDKTVVIYGGADLRKFPYVPNPCPPHQAATILLCGRLVEKKGFIYGIRAFLKIAPHYPRLRLKIIGTGRLAESCKHEVESSTFKNQIEFLGNKTHAEYIEELKHCHLFLAPSVTARNGDCEGLPTVLIEAAAIGRPLLATWHSGIPEIVQDGRNGLLSPEKDVEALAANIEKLLNKPEQWPAYSAHGRALVEAQFDLQKQAAKIENLYSAVLSGSIS
ncbi:putative glycosyl transferase [Candidatus Termititenax persephonae]|uniref:Glycosyl transferase n=1 Tax=Candidatus Termititenax persephonae TaxID=2218525 RepID=A0A388THX8_9BACT|nr:putative glycosyl transferase [Candidatus Termititenax persephonae]